MHQVPNSAATATHLLEISQVALQKSMVALSPCNSNTLSAAPHVSPLCFVSLTMWLSITALVSLPLMMIGSTTGGIVVVPVVIGWQHGGPNSSPCHTHSHPSGQPGPPLAFQSSSRQSQPAGQHSFEKCSSA